MAQKFPSLDDAADQLGVSKDRLTKLREAGKERAYRDGASWKFRSEDIDKLVAEGLPNIHPRASDLALALDAPQISSSVGDSEPAKSQADSDLGLASDEENLEPA